MKARTKTLSLFATEGPNHFTLRLCFERLLKVFGVNIRLRTLHPGHARSLRSVDLNEIGLGRTSGNGEEALSAMGECAV
jgi:hypothetical protein